MDNGHAIEHVPSAATRHGQPRAWRRVQ
jgi:hypothetical protein